MRYLMMETNIEYKCFVDSIQLRVENVDLVTLFKNEYYDKTNSKKEIKFKDKKSFRDVFKIKKVTNPYNKDKQHIALSFNGFKKYDSFRDILIKDEFLKIVKILLANDIKFYLNKIDLTIDFYNIKFKDLFVKRLKYKGIQRSIKHINDLTLYKIVKNISSFYLENTTSNKNSTQRLYIYNKTEKEKKNGNTLIDDNIYRVEAELVNFNKLKKLYDKNISSIELELLSMEFDNRRNKKTNKSKLLQLEISKEHYKQEFNRALLEEIKLRFNKYEIKCKDKCITFDYTIVENILPLCNNL